MPLTDQNITDLQTLSRAGKKIHVAEYIRVDWNENDANETRYYSTAKYNSLPGFGTIGLNIEARLLGEPFKQFELYPDLRTDTIPLVFDDIDRTIRGRFQAFGSGVHIEFFSFYPQVNAHDSKWFGQLQAPQIYGRKKIETIATNGYRSREQFVPGRRRPRECGWGKFGGQLTAEALLTAGCKYDRHTGGSIGNFKTGSTPYSVCTFDEAGCAARGMTPYFGGYKPDASAVVTDQNSGYLAVSKGNASNLRQPIRVIAGTKIVRSNQLLFWRREMNANNQDRGFVAGVWEVSEGPNRNVRNVKVGEKLIEAIHWNPRLGTPAQVGLLQYAPDIGNFSNVCHYFARNGWVDPLTWNASTMISECAVDGYTQVTTITALDAISRIWTNNRTWWLLTFMDNQRFGMSYPMSRFNYESWRTCASWTGKSVTFSYTNADGETRNFAHTRSSFDCVVEGRPVAEQLVDICRSGRISVPYQMDGQFHVQPFRAFTQDELDDAVVFTDSGPTQNILRGADDEPLLIYSEIPDDKIVNEITLVFEDGANGDNERPITVDNPNQKLRAGRALGENNLQSVPTRIAAYGVRNLNEAVKLGYGLLYFGEFDEGGILNNGSIQIEVPLVEALSVRRYQPIKIVSEVLDGFETPDNPLFTAFSPVEYFRVLRIIKTSKDTAIISGQVYNHEAYRNFETVAGDTPGDPPDWPPTIPTTPTPDPNPTPIPRPCEPTLKSLDYSTSDNRMLVEVEC